MRNDTAEDPNIGGVRGEVKMKGPSNDFQLFFFCFGALGHPIWQRLFDRT